MMCSPDIGPQLSDLFTGLRSTFLDLHDTAMLPGAALPSRSDLGLVASSK